MHLVNYRKNQDMLMETPASALADFTPATASARLVVDNALATGNTILSEPEAKAVLTAYGSPRWKPILRALPPTPVVWPAKWSVRWR